MSSSAKRQVIQRLHDMGFSDSDIRAAITECGYNVEACADWIVNRKQTDKKPRLFVGMEVWIFSPDDNDWAPGNVVSITKQLLSIIFNGHDFRWLEKESDLYRIQDDKPAPLHNNTGYGNNNRHNRSSNQGHNDEDDVMDDPYNADGGMQQEYTPPRQDEQDYYVTFTESVLGLELYSDEDGFNCIVGRCVSTIARQKVTPGSQIVQVNDRWLANYRFEEIRDAVKQAARQPPLAVTFRIKKNLLRRKNSPQQQNINIPNNGSNNPNPYGNNGYDQSQSATSPDTHNNNNVMRGDDDDDNNDRNNNNNNTNNNGNKLKAPKSGRNANSVDEEKRSQPNDNLNGNGNDETDFMGTLPFDQCDKLQIGDHIDHRDDVGRFLLATIVDKDQYKVKIHYEGWNSKWDTWCDYKGETHRFAAPRSISRKPNTRFRDLKIRDYVDINPIQRHRGWRVGQIRRMDKYSGQAQIVYKEDGQEFLYWAHLNNPEEIAPFMTRAAETIALQQKIAEFEEEQDQNGNDNNHSKSQNNPNIQQPSDSGSPDQININGNNMNTNPLAANNNNNNMDQSNNNGNNNLNPLSPHRGNNQAQQTFNNSNANPQQQQLLNSFMSPPATTIATDQSMGYNSNVATMNSYAHQSHGSMQFSNNGQGQHQPPPANGINDNSYNRGGSGGQMSGGMGGGGSNLNLYSQIPNDNGRNVRPMGAGHQKSRSRVFPTTIKNKKLPPKPAKNMAKKRNKGINRSRTQPLPDNQNNSNNPAYNGGNNGYNNQQQQQYGYNNNNNGQYQQQGMMRPQQGKMGGNGNNTTNFNDLSFNAPQQFQSQKHTSTTNFMHGQTTYTAQVKPSQSNPNLMNNINVNASASHNNNQHNYQQSYGTNLNNRPPSNLNMTIEQQYGSVSSPVNGKKLPPNPFPKKYSGDQHDNI